MSLVSYYTPWKQTIWGFLFSNGIERDQWHERGEWILLQKILYKRTAIVQIEFWSFFIVLHSGSGWGRAVSLRCHQCTKHEVFHGGFLRADFFSADLVTFTEKKNPLWKIHFLCTALYTYAGGIKWVIGQK